MPRIGWVMPRILLSPYDSVFSVSLWFIYLGSGELLVRCPLRSARYEYAAGNMPDTGAPLAGGVSSSHDGLAHRRQHLAKSAFFGGTCRKTRQEFRHVGFRSYPPASRC